MKKKLKRLLPLLLLAGSAACAQVTQPVNGVADNRNGCYAFTNATVVKDALTTLSNATLVIREGRITAVGSNLTAPPDAVVIDCKGKYIYPSFIDIFSDYGIAVPQRGPGGFNFNAPAQLTSNTKGAFGWNQAVKAEVSGADLFVADDAKAKTYRDIGFGTVFTHQKDGIARGTGSVVTLANKKENMVMLKDRAAAVYSFSKGSSTQSYPGSVMGSIALLRQTYLDAQWYKGRPAGEGTNLSLQAWTDNQALPQIFDANDKWANLRADRIGDEFGVQYIIKGGGNEYQRIGEMAATKASFILPLNFPQAMDVEDPNDVRFVALEDMKHWEMAPTNPGAFEKAGINFCLTPADLKDTKQFWANLRKAMENGLSEKAAFDALTKNPAQLLGVYTETGSLDVGKWANLLITSGPVFAEKTTFFQNWVQGNKYVIKDEEWQSSNGVYALAVKKADGPTSSYKLEVKSNSSATAYFNNDTLAAKFNFDGKQVKFSFPMAKKSTNTLRLNGFSSGNAWNGMAEDGEGKRYTWTATYTGPLPAPVDTAKKNMAKADSTKKKEPVKMGSLTWPNGSYGWAAMPQAENILIKNATVWTNEAAGKLANTDVLVKNGKIVQVGKNLSDATAKVIDGTGKHLTAGVIDEHSHIAAASINEGGQSVTSEVRIADNLDPDDINIYRQLSGGVTTSHILHGSANTIGGQTQLIKLRWGANDQQLKFAGSDGFIKFALGENVKRTPSQNNNRFPDTRMGVEQVLMDAFTRAKDYETALKGPNAAKVRRDLELDALVEIMNKKRFITCHSYVQSEIIGMMRVAERFGFTLNTFTHILEGYKVADKMKAHGAAASTFSDWWAYKMEVQDAIPYNAAIMQRVGLNVAINSDDAEMARRLNQEAAKSVKYGGMGEEDALKMVTLNPAKMLHIDQWVGSIKVGKDADLVLWSDHPLSIYAKAEKTMVDGIVYFDRERDKQLRQQIMAERSRLVQKMLNEKKGGGPTGPAMPSFRRMNTCSEHNHKHGLLVVDVVEE
jgi:imidazolonepropionase-like amidohydrolase